MRARAHESPTVATAASGEREAAAIAIVAGGLVAAPGSAGKEALVCDARDDRPSFPTPAPPTARGAPRAACESLLRVGNRRLRLFDRVLRTGLPVRLRGVLRGNSRRHRLVPCGHRHRLFARHAGLRRDGPAGGLALRPDRRQAALYR